LQRLKGILGAREPTAPHALPEAADPVIARAVANEEAAAAFYRHAAQAAQREDTREALEGLAREEEEHKRLLQDFKAGKELPASPAAKEAGILESVGAPDFSHDMSPADAFLLAARKEKLAADFYTNWADLCPPGPERDVLMKLSEIERKHKATVEAMFTNAAFPERW
jgi:rubrerythrin